MVVGDQGAYDGPVSVVVMPDGGGAGEDALEDAGDHAGRGVPAMAFEVKLALEGVVDRLDDLAQWLEELIAGTAALACAGRAQQADLAAGQGCLEVVAVVVLVGDGGDSGSGAGVSLVIGRRLAGQR